MIKIQDNMQRNYTVTTAVFPGGELQVDLDNSVRDQYITVRAALKSAADVMELVMVTEILDRCHAKYKKLVMKYLPYARQDRIMRDLQAFSLKPMAKIINTLQYHDVEIWDAHSDVAAALLDNVTVKSQLACMQSHAALEKFIAEQRPVIIAPDAGAYKKAQAAATYYELDVAIANKLRDASGRPVITGLTGDVAHRSCLMVDDICDGGRTFLDLARVLAEHRALDMSLYVTHGIFSNGLDVFAGSLQQIFTVNAFASDGIMHHVFNN